VTIQIGDREAVIDVADFNFQENSATFPDTTPSWDFSELLSHVVEAEPRAQLEAIKVVRTVEGKPKEWTVDLRPDQKGKLVRNLPARLANGDKVVVPLLPLNHPEALAARMKGIYRAMPGRMFGDRIFAKSEKDDAPRTLCELIVESYRQGPFVVANPDFAHIRIHRLNADASAEESVEVDLASRIPSVTAQTSSAEAAKLDVPLQWGDVVEISSRKDVPPAEWNAFDPQTKLFLIKVLTRTVSIVQNGKEQQTPLRLNPNFRSVRLRQFSWNKIWDVESATAAFRLLPNRLKLENNFVKIRVRSRGSVREFTPEEFKNVNPWLLDGDKVEIESF